MKKSFFYVWLVRKREYIHILFEETALSNKVREKKMNSPIKISRHTRNLPILTLINLIIETTHVLGTHLATHLAVLILQLSLHLPIILFQQTCSGIGQVRERVGARVGQPSHEFPDRLSCPGISKCLPGLTKYIDTCKAVDSMS